MAYSTLGENITIAYVVQVRDINGNDLDRPKGIEIVVSELVPAHMTIRKDISNSLRWGTNSGEYLDKIYGGYSAKYHFEREDVIGEDNRILGDSKFTATISIPDISVYHDRFEGFWQRKHASLFRKEYALRLPIEEFVQISDCRMYAGQ